jgi:hypothetical protein
LVTGSLLKKAIFILKDKKKQKTKTKTKNINSRFVVSRRYTCIYNVHILCLFCNIKNSKTPAILSENY